MEHTHPTPEEAADLLVRGSTLTAAVGDADTGRRKIYVLWSFVLPFAMVWFDIFGQTATAALAMMPFVLVGVAGTLLVVRQQQVTDMAAMKSYFVIMAIFSVTWVLLVGFVGPRLGDELSFGWTLTGLIGSIPFIVGYLWDRAQ